MRRTDGPSVPGAGDRNLADTDELRPRGNRF
jgi:hypothetical protein